MIPPSDNRLAERQNIKKRGSLVAPHIQRITMIEAHNIWQMVCSLGNIRAAANAVLGYVAPEEHLDRLTPERRAWVENRENEEREIARILEQGSYAFGDWASMTVYEPKERCINFHADWRSNILEMSVLNVLEHYYEANYSRWSYSSIKGRGTMAAKERVVRLARKFSADYYVQIDVRKYFQNIDHDILLAKTAEIVKDDAAMRFIKKQVESFGPGIPIGAPFSRLHSNLYLDDLDHRIEQHCTVLGFVRNMDDIILFTPDKQTAHEVLQFLREELALLKLEVKSNARIAPVATGIRTLGFVIYPTHTRVSKRIKQNMKRLSRRLIRSGAGDDEYKRRMSPHYGWCKQADAAHLMQSVMGDRLHLFDKMKIRDRSELKPMQKFFGLDKDRFCSIRALAGVRVYFLELREAKIRGEQKMALKFCIAEEIGDNPTEEEINASARYTITKSASMMERLKADADILPFAATVTEVEAKSGNRYFVYH